MAWSSGGRSPLVHFRLLLYLFSSSSTEEGDTTDDSNRAIAQVRFQNIFQIRPIIIRVAEYALRVVGLHQSFGDKILWHALTQNGCAKDNASVDEPGFEIVKDHALTGQGTRETMEQVAECDGVETRLYPKRFQDIGDLRGRAVSRQALCRHVKTVRVQIYQRDRRAVGWEFTFVQKIARPDAHLQMLG